MAASVHRSSACENPEVSFHRRRCAELVLLISKALGTGKYRRDGRKADVEFGCAYRGFGSSRMQQFSFPGQGRVPSGRKAFMEDMMSMVTDAKNGVPS